MKNRRDFLGVLSVVSGAALGAAAASQADAGAATPPPAPPSMPPHTPPSAAALAFAAGCRAYDPRLSDAEIETIARAIDANRAAAAALNPKRKPLRNSDEPVTRFAAEPGAYA